MFTGQVVCADVVLLNVNVPLSYQDTMGVSQKHIVTYHNENSKAIRLIFTFDCALWAKWNDLSRGIHYSQLPRVAKCLSSC